MIHITPNDDIIQHNTNSDFCQCNPVIDYENDLVIHYAMDARPQLPEKGVKELLVQLKERDRNK